MTQVFRIEDSDGEGPFVGHDLSYDFDIIAKAARLPRRASGAWHNGFRDWSQEPRIGPRADSLTDPVSGFRDLDQLRRWFPAEAMLRLMDEEGLEVVTYDIPDARGVLLKGRDQVVFDRALATPVSSVPPTSIQ